MRRSEWGHAPLREPSGNASKGGGAANVAEQRAEPRVAKGGAPPYKRRTDARLALSLIVAHVGCSSLRKRHQLSLQKGSIPLALSLKRLGLSPWVSLSKALPSSSLIPALVARRGLLVETRTVGAAVRPVVDLRIRPRGAGEGSPAAWEAGTRSDHADGHGRGGLYGR